MFQQRAVTWTSERLAIRAITGSKASDGFRTAANAVIAIIPHESRWLFAFEHCNQIRKIAVNRQTPAGTYKRPAGDAFSAMMRHVGDIWLAARVFSMATVGCQYFCTVEPSFNRGTFVFGDWTGPAHNRL